MHKLFILLFSLWCVSAVSADALDDAIALFRRQSVQLSTGGASDSTAVETSSSVPTSSSSEDDSTTTSSIIASPTSSASVVTESSTITQSPTESPSTTVVVSTSTFTPTNSAGSVTTTEASVSTVSTSTITPSKTLITTSATEEVITTITSVNSGSTVHITSTSSGVVPVTTSVDPASLTNGDGSHHGSSGLSDTAKKTIGGVVGGVGGALVLAGLAYTAWRIWGKKKNLHDDDLYDPNLNQDKLSAATGSESTPFRSTLDQYHSPGPVNTASNF